VVLLIPIVYLSYQILTSQAKENYDKLLYFAIVVSVGGSLMQVIGISTQFLSYRLMLISSTTLTIAALALHPTNRIRYFTFIYSVGNIILVFRLFSLSKALTFTLPVLELLIVIGIIYYNYKIGISFDELFVIIIVTTLGFYLGKFVTNFDVPTLILGTLFDQTLSLGQYTLTVQIGAFTLGSFNSEFFLALHMAEVFNIIVLHVIMRRSKIAMGLIISGIDMTYPPILAFRAMLVLLFMRKTMGTITDNSSTFISE
jgi:hypothetical protein